MSQKSMVCVNPVGKVKSRGTKKPWLSPVLGMEVRRMMSKLMPKIYKRGLGSENENVFWRCLCLW